MKKLISIVLILCMACMMIPAVAEESSLLGTWYLKEAVSGEMTLDVSMLGMNMSIELKEDGTAVVVTAYGEESASKEGTWAQDGDAVTVTVDGQPGQLAYADGTLVMEQEGGKMIFTQEVPEAATPTTTLIDAESEEAFFGTWELSSMEIMGQVVPVSLLSGFGIEMTASMTIEAGKAILAFSFNGEAKEAEIPTVFAEGKLALSAEETESEFAPLSLTESGDLAFVLPIGEQVFSLYLSPVQPEEGAEEPAA